MESNSSNSQVGFAGISRRRSLTVAAVFAAASLQPLVRAAVVPIPEIITSDTTYGIGLGDTIGPTIITAGTGNIIADGARLVITRPDGVANSRLFDGTAFDTLATLNISGTNGGRVVFRDLTYTKNDTQASVSAIGDLAAITAFNVTGADFINNSSGGPPAGYPGAGATAYNGLAGIFNFNRAGLASTFTDVLFEGNWSWGEGGVARLQNGAVVFNDVTVRGNYTRGSKNAGAFTFNTNATLAMSGGVIEANRTASQGGAFGFGQTASSVVTLSDVLIKDNWAANAGGAFMNNSGTVQVRINITAAAAPDWLYSGNLAGNEAINSGNNSTTGWHMTSVIGQNMVDNIAPVASAKRGGFFWGNNNGGQLTFDIAPAHTLTIGVPGEPDEDTFATTTTHIFRKQGAGDLILNSDNSYWMGRVFVNGGRLLLGNANAKLGGAFTMLGTGTLGGTGTLVTYNQSDALQATTVVMNGNGSTIQVGNGNPGDTLSILGAVTGSAGSIFHFDLFEGNQSSLLHTSTLTLLTSATIRLGQVVSGTFTLATWDTLNASAVSIGVAGVSSARAQATPTLDTTAKELRLDVTLANSSSLRWTGASGALWQANGAQSNWTGTTAFGTVTDFQQGDTVFFDGSGDNRDILIGTGTVRVAAITVDGAGNHSFSGGALAATGGLTKAGTGTLTFANTTANDFGSSGVTLAGGLLAISDPAQLGGTLSVVHFAASATAALLALDDVAFAGGDQRLSLAGGADATLSAAPGKTFAISGATVTGAGALANVPAGVRLTLNNLTFINIAATGTGGALANSGTLVLLDPVFTGNAATGPGGAVFNAGILALNTTVSATYAGNTASSGGFLYQAATGTATLDTAGGVTLVIGDTAATSKDTITGLAGSLLTKTGSGTLVLNADNAANAGTINIAAGTLVLGHAAAKLGGLVNIQPGATAAGLGAFTGTLAISAGGTLRVGNDDAVASSLTLGALDLSGGTLVLDLYAGGTSDKLFIDTLASVSGSTIIDVNGFRFGEHVIASIGTGAGLLTSGTVDVTIGGRVQSGARQSMTLSVTGTNVLLTGIADSSRILTWTGSGALNTAWDTENTNWTDGAAVNRFAEGDRMIFDATSLAATHTIAIAGSNIAVSDMIVTGNADYTFTGGAIIADAARVVPGIITGAAGKLTKDGPGKLTLANDGTNTFAGGIDLAGGILALATPGASGTAAITAAGTGTLQAAVADLALANTLDTAAAALAFDTQAHAATLAGPLNGSGLFAKLGTGTLALTGSGAFTGTARLDAGALALGHSAALGTGRLAANGGRVLLAADGLALANPIQVGSAALSFDTAGFTGTLTGAIEGAGLFAKEGAGELVLASAGALSGTLAVSTGRLTLAHANALGSAKLAGTGTLGLATGAVYQFAPTAAGAGFAGAVAVSSGKLVLDANAAAVFVAPAATLNLETGGAAEKISGDLALGDLAFKGGLLVLPMAGAATAGLLTVRSLDLSGGGQIGADVSAFLASQTNPPVPPAQNVLDQDDFALLRLVATDSITGPAGAVTIVNPDGTPLPTPAYADITQGGETVARAGIGFNAVAVTGGTDNGLYLGHGLTELDILDGKTFRLSNAGAADSALSARITGAGGLEIAADGTVQVVSTGIGTMRLVTHGAAVITLASPGNTFTGTTTVANGVLQAGAAGIFATSAAVVVRDGAVFDLGGFAQTVKNLSGDGWVLLGSSALTVGVADGETSAFNGSFSGAAASRVIKTGAGKLVLGTPSAYPFDNSIAWPWFAGITEFREGALGLATSAAFGRSTLSVAGDGLVLSAEASGLVVSNSINLGSNQLVLESAHPAAYTGVIAGAGGRLLVRGAGAVTLSGENTYTGGLAVAGGARVVAGHARAIGTGSVEIGAGAALEFRLASNGTVNNPITGDTLEFAAFDRHATLSLGGNNTLVRFNVRDGGRVTATGTGALGGNAVAVTIAGGGELAVNQLGTVAGTLDVQRGGRLIFNPSWAVNTDPMLAVDEARFADGAIVGFGKIASGDYVLLRAGSLVVEGTVNFDAGIFADLGVDISNFRIDAASGEITFRALNQLVNPGKDIASAYDAMAATNGAVYSRLSESFLSAFERVPAGGRGSFWVRGVGSFSDNDGGAGRLGYKSDSWGAIAGYDRQVSANLLLGGYAGSLNTTVKGDDRRSENDGTLPYGGLYAALKTGGWWFAADLMLGSHDARTSRYEQTGIAVGHYKADAWAASFGAGAVFGAWEKGSIRPSVSLHYMGLRYRGQDEAGAGAVLIDDFSTDTLEGLVSVGATQEIATPWVRPGLLDLTLGWRNALSDPAMKIAGRFADNPAAVFSSPVDHYNRDGLMLGLGLRLALTDRAGFSLGYDYELGSQFARHTLNTTLRWTW